MRPLFAATACLSLLQLASFAAAGPTSQTVLNDGGEYEAISQQLWQSSRTHEVVTHTAFSEHGLRITAEPTLCDPSVQQYSGYLDISDGRHLFFWFFEARESPHDAPLMMWLNGGPGCSSTMGLLFELGPCTVVEEGKSTALNKHSWNQHANMIFLDSPINSGFSYSSDGSTVETLENMATDVYAFLTLFLSRYTQYASVPFHLAAESWGGHYAPHIGNLILKKNNELKLHPESGIEINLASLIIANGLTDPFVQFLSVPDYACGGAPYPPLDPSSAECTTLRRDAAICASLIDACYKFPSNLTCTPATTYCWTKVLGAIGSTDRNPYDLRRPCEVDSPTCYSETVWIEHWMNDEAHKKAVGVDRNRPFAMCNMTVNAAFYARGQAMRNTAALLPEIINDGVRLLVLAGNTDWICNYMGVERWMRRLGHKFHAEFAMSPSKRWKTAESGIVGGEVRSAGHGAGNVTFVQVYDAGHMAPHDQPEVTADMIRRWIQNVPFSSE